MESLPRGGGTSVSIVDNLTSGGSTSAASAETVKTLKALVDQKASTASVTSALNDVYVTISAKQDALTNQINIKSLAGVPIIGSGDISLSVLGAATSAQGAKADTALQSIPVASASVLGAVKQGTNVTIAPDGTISATGGSSVTPSSTAPLANAQTASVGSSANYARADHVHKESLTVLGYNTTTKTLSYQDEAGDVTALDLSGLAVDMTVTGATYNTTTGVLTLTESAGGPTVTVDLSTLKSVTSGGSLTGDGATSTLQLSGDATTPGNLMLYGTNSSGVKGWYGIPAMTAATSAEITAGAATGKYIDPATLAAAYTWQVYTPNITGTTTNPTLGTNTRSAMYMVVGKTLFLSFRINQTAAGGAGAGDYLISLPPGFIINTAVAPINAVGGYSGMALGSGVIVVGGTATSGACTPITGTTNTTLKVAAGASVSPGINTWNSAWYSTTGALHLYFTATIPIL
jgi:hypothetical protein